MRVALSKVTVVSFHRQVRAGRSVVEGGVVPLDGIGSVSAAHVISDGHRA